jgi:hyperosmotically inducible protein
MKSDKPKMWIVAAAAFVFVACSDQDNTARTPSVGADGQRPTAERIYAEAETERMPGDVQNSGRNVRDRNDAAVTAGDQSNSERDIGLTQEIRQGITSNDDMSMQARNVKVISQDGVVTLRGPVETEQEKESIESLARNAGATRIDNQIEIVR